MAHFGTLRDYRFAQESGDIRGASLYGINDEKLGKIEDVIFDHSSGALRYAVVDTGGWLTTRLFLVPANQIFARPKHDDDFAVNLTKEQIERFPAYNETIVDRPDEFHEYEQRYRKEFSSGPVMHREGSNHLLTPEPSEMPAADGNLESREGYNFTPDRIADKFSDTAPDPNKTRMRPSGLAARAEDTARPGSSAELEKTTAAQRRAETTNQVETSTGRDSISDRYDGTPIAGDEAAIAEQDSLMNPDDLYAPAAERHRRVTSFEDLLRKNRVDIAARCGSCAEKKDEAA
jgi:PRC-barrel domain